MIRHWYLIFLLLVPVYGQGCSSTCPPLDSGVPVPSLCTDDNLPSSSQEHPTCWPSSPTTVNFDDLALQYDVIVISNYFVGCNAGRRESGVYAYSSQRLHDEHPNVVFVSSVKGGGCETWTDRYNDFAEDEFGLKPTTMPITIEDASYAVRDLLFTSPYPHPSYVVLDSSLKVRDKFVGPCCGYESYTDCSVATAKTLDSTLQTAVEAVLSDPAVRPSLSPTTLPTPAPTAVLATPSPPPTPASTSSLAPSPSWTPWSSCSATCGNDGIKYRTLEESVQISPCDEGNTLPDCTSCSPGSFTVSVLHDGFDEPSDVKLHPTPGLHLGAFSSGRDFPTTGPEAWVSNRGNHSISVIPAAGTFEQTSFNRVDRGYFHYNSEIAAISFNKVDDSGRDSDRDTFNYFATCQGNSNDYLQTKTPNYFMGPTLYNSSPDNRNLVNKMGKACEEFEECYFLHSDMLHEAPHCTGIVHDPETLTGYGTVFWQVDGWNNELVRFDFQKPHGPGSMDHAVAAIRRYPEVKITPNLGKHTGMVIDASTGNLYFSDYEKKKIVVMDTTSGAYARTARIEYPIYSSRLPSFEYSIYECALFRDFASIDNPTGLALFDGKLYVASVDSPSISVFSLVTSELLFTIPLPETHVDVAGMDIDADTQMLYYVDATLEVLASVDISASSTCSNDASLSIKWAFPTAPASTFEKFNCTVNATLPPDSLFDQVHVDSGYASEDQAVQDDSMMDESAVLLANRTDCGNVTLNFDALLLGGYFCHICLPGGGNQFCGKGGICKNVQWEGIVCDNEHFIKDGESWGGEIILKGGAEVRFTISLQGKVVGVFLDDGLEEAYRGGGVYGKDGVEKGAIVVDGDEVNTVLYVGIPGQPSHGLFKIVVEEEEDKNDDLNHNAVLEGLGGSSSVFVCGIWWLIWVGGVGLLLL